MASYTDKNEKLDFGDSDSETGSSESGVELDVEETDGEEEAEPVVCFFCPESLPTVQELVNHGKEKHEFDLEASIRSLGSDFYTCIRLVNYLRIEGEKGNVPKDITKDTLIDDTLLQPVRPDDPLLYSLGDFLPQEAESIKSKEEVEEGKSELKRRTEEIKFALLENEWPDANATREKSYFQSYAHASMHKSMLQDKVRTEAYRDFIYKNKHLFEGKTILDVGCGTGILSMFCAKAGAKKVFAVDNSDIARKAEEIVKANGLQKTIYVHHGLMEDQKLAYLIGGRTIDIIVSEWMGYALLFEGMLESVLKARDRYLKPDGLMLPTHCTLRIAPLSDPKFMEESMDATFWKDVYGFDMSPMLSLLDLNDKDVSTITVPTDSLSSDSALFQELKMQTVTPEELQFSDCYAFTLKKDITSLDAFVIWFDTFFMPPPHQTANVGEMKPEDVEKFGGVVFTTGPQGVETHWQQAMLMLEEKKKPMELKAGTKIEGHVTYRKIGGDHRALEVTVTWHAENGSKYYRGMQTWAME
jgi:protein arginine N-methyltransferase 3